MSLRDHLQTIYESHGQLTPALVVDEARKPTHPLHERFEWDDSVAGEAYRKAQASSLIRSVRVVYKDDESGKSDVPQYVSINTEDGHVYRRTDEVMQDEFASRLLMQGLERDVRSLQRKYGHLSEFSAIVRRELLEPEAEAS